MKKICILLLSLLLTISLAACGDSKEIETALDTYCENNAESTICTNPQATRNEIVSDMAETIITEFIDGSNESFCTDYFAHEGLIEKCKSDRYSLIPEDVLNENTTLQVIEGESSSDFEIKNECESDQTCYQIDVSVIETEEIVKFTKFQYQEIPSEVTEDELSIPLDDIRIFMHYAINPQVKEYTCDEVFVGTALSDCDGDFKNMASSELMYEYVVTKIGVNEYTLSAENFNGTEQVEYTFTLSGTESEYFISELTYVLSTDTVVEPGEDLGLTLEEVKNYMQVFVGYSDTTPCTWKFIDEALDVCNQSSVADMLAPSHIVYDGTVAKLDTNTYTYSVNSEDLLQSVVYTVILGGTKEEIRVKDVSYVLTDNFDTFDHALDLFRDFKDDFNDSTISLQSVCDNYIIESKVSDCISFFEPVKEESFDYFESIEFPTGTYLFTLSFSNVEDWLDLSFNLTSPSDGEYRFNIDFDPEYKYVREMTDETITTYLSTLYYSYYNDESFDCEMYFSNTSGALDLCTSNSTGIFPAVEPDYITWDPNDAGYFISLFRQYDDGSFGALYPVYKVFFGLGGGFIKISMIELSETPDATNVADVNSQFESDILNSSISNLDFCASINSSSNECQTFRQSVLDGNTVSFTYNETTNNLGETIMVLEVDVDGTVSTFEMVLGTDFEYQNNTFYVEGLRPLDSTTTSTNDDTCNCEKCDVCECEPCEACELETYITHEPLVQMFFRQYESLFNDSLYSNQEFADLFYQGVITQILNDRESILLSGGISIDFIEVLYNQDLSYKAIALDLSYVMDGKVYIYHEQFHVEKLPPETFKFISLEVDELVSQTEAEAHNTFTNYISDFTSVALDNSALTELWDHNGNLDVSSRFQFLIAGGTLEILDVKLEGTSFVAYYKETISETETYYKQHFISYEENGSIVVDWYQKEEYEPPRVVLDEEMEQLEFINVFLDDLYDQNISNEELCDNYMFGLESCTLRDYISLGGTIVTRELQNYDGSTVDMFRVRYVVSYSGTTSEHFMNILVTELQSGKYETIVQDYTYTYQDMLGNELNVNLMDYFEYVELYVTEFGDNTISHADFCNEHFYIDLPLQSYYASIDFNTDFIINCINVRENYFEREPNVTFEYANYFGYSYQYANVELQNFSAFLYGSTNQSIEEMYFGMNISVAPDSTSPNGFRVNMDFGSDQLFGVSYMSKGRIQSALEEEIAFINDPINNNADICSRWNITEAGNQCLQNIQKVKGLDFVGYEYNYESNLFNSISSYMYMLVLTLTYVDQVSLEPVVVQLQLSPTINYEYTNNTYSYSAFTYIELPEMDFNYNEIFGYLDSFISAYFNPNIPYESFLDLFHGNVDDGELAYIRDQDQQNTTTPQLLKYMTFTGITDNSIIYLTIQDGDKIYFGVIQCKGYDSNGIPIFRIFTFVTNEITANYNS